MDGHISLRRSEAELIEVMDVTDHGQSIRTLLLITERFPMIV